MKTKFIMADNQKKIISNHQKRKGESNMKWHPDQETLNGMYPKSAKEQEVKLEAVAGLNKNWNQNTNPFLASLFPTMLSDAEKAEMEIHKQVVLAHRKAKYERGEADVSTIMYPSMAANISIEEVRAAMDLEEKRKELEIWNEANRIADERKAREAM